MMSITLHSPTETNRKIEIPIVKPEANRKIEIPIAKPRTNTFIPGNQANNKSKQLFNRYFILRHIIQCKIN